MIKRFGMSNTNAEWAGFALRSLCLALMLATLASGLFRPLGVAADASATGTVYSHFFGCDTNKMAIYQDHGYLKQNCTDTTYYVTWSLVSEGQNYSPIQGASPADVRFDNVPNHIFTM